MFIGEYSHTIDDKGRLAVPKKFRTSLGKSPVITRGLDSCLFLYTAEEWEKIAQKLSALPISQKNTRAFSRLMLAGAMDVSLDKQGRIMIPEYLRTYGKLTKNTIVAGLYNRLEIWDEDAWSQYKDITESQSEEIAEQLSELGI